MGSSFSSSSSSYSSSSSSYSSSSSSYSSSSSSYKRGGAYRCNALARYDDDLGRQARVHHSSDFCDPESLVDHLQPGDLIQAKGNFVLQWFYSHFAVYIGNGDVIHIVESGSAQRGAMVDLFRGQLVRKNNLHDDILPPQPRPLIVFDARSWLDKHWDYNPLTNNCEHFATMCRYDRKISLQGLGMGDVIARRVSMGEYLYQNVGRSVKEACNSFLSWASRKVLGGVAAIGSGMSNLLSIGW